MAPAGRQGHPKVTIGTPKGDIVDHNRTTPSMEEDRIYSEAIQSSPRSELKRDDVDDSGAGDSGM